MFFKNLFFSDTYSLAYRYDCEEILSDAPYNVIRYKKEQWYADPFLFEDKGEIYLFCEVMNHKIGRGTIGVKKLDKDISNDFEIVIKEQFHLSYPMVFRFKDQIYMIPETCGCKQLRLYKCNDFPREWQLCWIIKENVEYVDTTFFNCGDYCMLETYDKTQRKNKILKIDIESKTVLDCTKGIYLDKRPGGGFFMQGEACYHALQNCDTDYGDYLHFCRVKSFDAQSGLIDSEQFVYKIEDVSLTVSDKYERVHTYNRCGNCEVIDLCVKKLDLKNVFLKFIRGIKYKLSKKRK